VDGDVKLPSIGQKEATGTATTTSGSASTTGSATGSAASATSTKKGSASGGKEITGMSVGLAAVMFGFMYWL
ncbi:hypothetical protein KHP62_22670, partial [Rhodobacteraceae bacterium NNCM2]|nr:hypothetical protein [Coraliihabitans acroporae]